VEAKQNVARDSINYIVSYFPKLKQICVQYPQMMTLFSNAALMEAVMEAVMELNNIRKDKYLMAQLVVE
jgi:hypothetical protein